jgi:hypothetical protein
MNSNGDFQISIADWRVVLFRFVLIEGCKTEESAPILQRIFLRFTVPLTQWRGLREDLK